MLKNGLKKDVTAVMTSNHRKTVNGMCTLHALIKLKIQLMMMECTANASIISNSKLTTHTEKIMEQKT
jgi:hypothetical protein